MSKRPKKRIHLLFRLMRIPNVFTAMADILAGYLIISGPHIQGSKVMLLLLSSSCIYAGGCVLNDLCDWRVDAKERPFRPIPSGKVSLNEAFLSAVLLFSTGLAAAYAAGEHSFLIALLLVLFVIIYDAAAKEIKAVGPLTMGICRAMNLILGMSPGFSSAGFPIIFPLISLIYVFSLTCLSAFEVTVRTVTKRGLLKGVFDPAPAAIGRAVKTLILGIPLIDAAYVSGVQGWTYGIPVALCIVPAMLLSRHFSMT